MLVVEFVKKFNKKLTMNYLQVLLYSPIGIHKLYTNVAAKILIAMRLL